MKKIDKSISTITIPKALNDELGQMFPYGQKGNGVEMILNMAVVAYKFSVRDFDHIFRQGRSVYEQSGMYGNLLKHVADRSREGDPRCK